LVYSTYLGGNGQDSGGAIAVDRLGTTYVTGFTYSTNFPTANPFKSTYGGNEDAFVVKLANPLTVSDVSVGAPSSSATYGTGSSIDYTVTVSAKQIGSGT